ncbi:MAG: CHRD domain-containing protein [Anaerolineae bacterium]
MMKKLTVITLIVLVALLATTAVVAAVSKTVYQAKLADETGTGSDAHGNAVFQFADDGSQMKYKLVVNGLDNTIMAHIHVASAPGANGPVVLWLYPDAPPFQPTLISGIFNGLLGSRTVTSADLVGPLAGMSLEDLVTAIDEGRAYVNVHTTAFPAGEIRGTIE